jgi:hypothetical protein
MLSVPVPAGPVFVGNPARCGVLVLSVVTLALMMLFVVVLTLLGHDLQLGVAAALALQAGVYRFSR